MLTSKLQLLTQRNVWATGSKVASKALCIETASSQHDRMSLSRMVQASNGSAFPGMSCVTPYQKQDCDRLKIHCLAYLKPVRLLCNLF